MNQRTIEEFGEQWSRFDDLGGYFGSVDVLRDICGPLLPLDEVAGGRVVEIGSGNGRIVTRVAPDFALAGLAHVLNFCLSGCVLLCRVLPLSLATYMREVMARFDRRKRYFLTFDQLNIGYAKYYTKEEARLLPTYPRYGDADIDRNIATIRRYFRRP